MKKLFAFLLFTYAIASAQITRLPDEFTVAERFISLTSTFDISTEEEPFAVARKRLLSFNCVFDLLDISEQPIAEAKSHFFSWGTIADVSDSSGKKIGWIEEEIFRIIPWAEYKIFNHENRLVAIARMNFFGTEFELFHPDNPNEVYATISRPLLRWYRDYWTVKIKNQQIFEQNIIDPMMLIILAIYQTDKDNRDRYRTLILNQIETEQNYNDFRS